MENQKENKKTNYKAIIISVIVTLVCINGGRYLMNQFNNSKYVVDEELMKVASETNKHLPIMVDSDTRLDNVIALPNKTIKYYYTFVNYSKDQFKPEAGKEFRALILDRIKKSSDVKGFRDVKATMVYLYRDKNNNEMFNFEYSYNDYKE